MTSIGDLTAALPSLPQLQTWVHRPQALAKCTISDVYQMKAVVYEGAGRYAGRDVFLLNHFPCRMVALVGWVAGVDDKEKTQVVYLDDGDGQCVMPITIHLAKVDRPVAAPSVLNESVPLTGPLPDFTSTHFSSARERKAQRRAAARVDVQDRDKGKSRAPPPVKAYQRHDIRVGDVLRVKGKVDEWLRGKEWVRQVTVEPGGGGSIEVVDADEQYAHLSRVMKLHRTVYSIRFAIPPLAAASTSTATSTPIPSSSFIDLTCSDSLELSSDMSVDPQQIRVGAVSKRISRENMSDGQLCDPSRLRSSQLTDRTFRHYVLDYISQQTAENINDISRKGEQAMRNALQDVFPEYKGIWSSLHSSSSSGIRSPFGPSASQNISMSDIDTNLTPRRSQRTLDGKAPPPFPVLAGFTISSLLEVSHLHQLAVLVVDEQSRKEEKRRLRRIRDGQATPKDLDLEHQRETKRQWRLSEPERQSRIQRLVKWVIRGLSEEGLIVQAGLGGHGQGRGVGVVDAYLPLTEPLLFPLLLPHLEAEMTRRSKTFMRRTDARYGHGILLEEVMGRLRRFGEAGRWERMGEWCVEDALIWGENRGLVRRVGNGWEVVSVSA